jgi:integrase
MSACGKHSHRLLTNPVKVFLYSIGPAQIPVDHNQTMHRLDARPYYWVSIILLHTGLRLNEACQMLVDDIVVVDGVDCFRLKRSFEEQGFKNHDVPPGAVVRDLPIHKQGVSN